MAFNLTGGQLYFVEVKPPFERLEFQFVPEKISNPREADIAQVAIIGRNLPRHHHTGGHESLAFTLDFYADEENRRDVKRKCDWLKSLTYNEGSGPARLVKLIWGELYSKETWVVKSVRPEFSMFHSQYGMLPCQAYVDIVLMRDSKTNITLRDARG